MLPAGQRLSAMKGKPSAARTPSVRRLVTHSCPWSDASACDQPYPQGELAAKTWKRGTSSCVFQLKQLHRVGASDLATVRFADLSIVESARGVAEVPERVVHQEHTMPISPIESISAWVLKWPEVVR